MSGYELHQPGVLLRSTHRESFALFTRMRDEPYIREDVILEHRGSCCDHRDQSETSTHEREYANEKWLNCHDAELTRHSKHQLSRACSRMAIFSSPRSHDAAVTTQGQACMRGPIRCDASGDLAAGCLAPLLSRLNV